MALRGDYGWEVNNNASSVNGHAREFYGVHANEAHEVISAKTIKIYEDWSKNTNPSVSMGVDEHKVCSTDQ